MLPGIAGISGFEAFKVTSIEYQAFAFDAVNRSVYTLASQPFGSAATDRVVVVFIASDGAEHTVSSVTIGGVSASIIAQQSSGVLTGCLAAAAVPTGTTGDVVVTMSTTISSCGVAIWRTTGLGGAVATASGSNTNLDALSLAVERGGFVIAGTANIEERRVTWSGATEVLDDFFEETNIISAASAVVLDYSVIVQPTLDGSASPVVFLAATF
jgi:hypothetical protein